MNKITKKLQKLVGTRKTQVVVSDQKSYKPYKKVQKSTPSESYYYGGSDNS